MCRRRRRARAATEAVDRFPAWRRLVNIMNSLSAVDRGPGRVQRLRPSAPGRAAPPVDGRLGPPRQGAQRG